MIGNKRIADGRVRRIRSNAIGRTRIGRRGFARKMTGMNRKCAVMMGKEMKITVTGWTGNMNGIIAR